MAIPSSGTISLAGIRAEITTNTYNASATVVTGLGEASTGTYGTINTGNDPSDRPNGSVPHAMSEFYAYDHDLNVFNNTKSVSRSLTGGTGQSIHFTSDDYSYMVEGDNWTISFWVRVGWTSALNTNIHLLTSHVQPEEGNATYQLSDGIRIYFDEPTGKLFAAYGSKTTSSNGKQKRISFTLASNSSVTGIGATGWNSSARGNTGDDNFTMITLTHAANRSSSTDDLKVYWNAAELSTRAVVNNDTLAVAMDSETDRLWSIGSNGKWGTNDQIKSGNAAETEYTDISFWNIALSSSQVSTMYNSGAPMDVSGTNIAQASNLKGWWTFEASNGNNSVTGAPAFTISGNSNIANV